MTIVDIGAGKQLEEGAAAAFARILAIRPGMLARVNSAYRSLEEQAVKRHEWEVDHSRPYASKPGQSQHNFGLALDIDSRPANDDHEWLVDHPEFGFIRPDGWEHAAVPEPWHFEYKPWLDQYADASDSTAPTVVVPLPMEIEDDDMSNFSVHVRTASPNGAPDGDWTLGHHEIGADLPTFADPVTPDMRRTIYDDGAGGVIVELRGLMVTNIQAVGIAWARTYAGGAGSETSRVVRDEYVQIQMALSLVAQATAATKK